MKIAIPVKMNKENTALAPLFGKAKWFAIVEDGTIQIVENPAQGGQAVVEWLAQSGVDTLIVQEMGQNPYQKVLSYGTIELYHAGFERVLLSEALQKFHAGELSKLDEEGMKAVIAHHEIRHTPHNEHAHHHHH